MTVTESNDSPQFRFLEGAKAAIPILLGILPFGIIFGVTAADIGISLIETMGMDIIVLAGASQLAGLQLINLMASPIVIVLTVWVINLRMVLYSASLSPYFQQLNVGWKLFLSWFLTDQVYAISISNFKQFPNKKSKHYFYTGAGLFIVFVFYIGTIIGFVAGNSIPESWQLGFGMPLTFLVLVIPTLIDKPALFASLFAGAVATISKNIPYHLGLLLAVSLAIPFGLWLESRSPSSLSKKKEN